MLICCIKIQKRKFVIFDTEKRSKDYINEKFITKNLQKKIKAVFRSKQQRHLTRKVRSP